MIKLTIPRTLKKYSMSLIPDQATCLVVVSRRYDSHFIHAYKTCANNGGFSKGSDKSFPLMSDVYVFEKRERPLIDFTNDTIELYNPLFQCQGLENATCAIPEGIYELELNYSSKFRKELPVVMDVPKRSGIRIHVGNTSKDSIGCLLVGQLGEDNNSLIRSTVTLDNFIKHLKINVPDRACIVFCDSRLL